MSTGSQSRSGILRIELIRGWFAERRNKTMENTKGRKQMTGYMPYFCRFFFVFSVVR